MLPWAGIGGRVLEELFNCISLNSPLNHYEIIGYSSGAQGG